MVPLGPQPKTPKGKTQWREVKVGLLVRFKFAGQYSPWSDLRHLGVMCWMMVGLIAEGKVNLTQWIDHVCTKAQIAQSTQRRLSRWVNNPRINPAKLYSPVQKC